MSVKFPPKKLIKQKLIDSCRSFFIQKGFQEITPPVLAPAYPLEPGITLFKTKIKDSLKEYYLSPSPETHLKRLLSQGLGNCFAICPAFRDEPSSPTHQPEFTILEWYELGKNYQDLMQTTEKLISQLIPTLSYQNKKYDTSPPWPRISLKQAIQKYAQIDLSQTLTLKTLSPLAQKMGLQVSSSSTWEELYHELFLNFIEPQILKNEGESKPVILFNYPTTLSPLCRPLGNGFSERFEFYLAGLELGDCYTELTDPNTQKQFFKEEDDHRKKHHLPTHPWDKELVKALEKGLPPCSGMAIGLDRLAMLQANSTNINNILFFPLS